MAAARVQSSMNNFNLGLFCHFSGKKVKKLCDKHQILESIKFRGKGVDCWKGLSARSLCTPHTIRYTENDSFIHINDRAVALEMVVSYIFVL